MEVSQLKRENATLCAEEISGECSSDPRLYWVSRGSQSRNRTAWFDCRSEEGFSKQRNLERVKKSGRPISKGNSLPQTRFCHVLESSGSTSSPSFWPAQKIGKKKKKRGKTTPFGRFHVSLASALSHSHSHSLTLSTPVMLEPDANTDTGDFEFRSEADDAWYSVKAVMDGERLTVKYKDFGEEHDNVFEAQSFGSLEELDDFKTRFRSISRQLQDTDCHKVVHGTVVCASHSLTEFDRRFFDAVIDYVFCRDHSFSNGEEMCTCTFLLVWQHGPIAGCYAEKKIENICLVEFDGDLDPSVAFFFEIARKKFETASQSPWLHCNTNAAATTNVTHQGETATLSLKPESIFAQQWAQTTKCARRSSGKICPSEVAERINDYRRRNGEDTDIGGESGHCVLLIDNLDKELSPSTMVEFIQRQTSVSVEAYVFPSLSFETYTKGAIVLDSRKNLEKLCKFLNSPDHIVISSNGRPWVVAEKLCGHEILRVATWILKPKRQNELWDICNGTHIGLKVVCSDSKGYEIAKRLRDTFLEFAEHQRRLHERLAMTVKEILQSPT